MAKTGERDPIFGLQAAAVMNLRADARVLRREQRRRERQELGPDKDLTEMVCNNARAIASLCGEVRKGGKDMRDAGKKMNRAQGLDATVAFLRTLNAEDRARVIRSMQVEASDG